jgi:hypothetical protein
VDAFQKYEAMLSEGSSPSQIYKAGRSDGLDSITLIRMIRKVCKLSLVDAKEVILTADRPGLSLNDIQEEFIPIIEKALGGDSLQGNSLPLPSRTLPSQEKVH